MKRRKVRRMQQHADALHAIHDQIEQRFAQSEDRRVRKQARFVRRAVNDAFSVGAERAFQEQESALAQQYEQHHHQQPQPYPYLTPETEERIYQRGFHDANLQHVAERARWQQERAALERQKALQGEFSQHDMDTARQASYNQGYTKGHNTGYRLGVQAGQAQRPQRPQQPAARVTDEVRQMMIDKVMDECRVIGESNPQMEAGMKAVRHRIKKIKFG